MWTAIFYALSAILCGLCAMATLWVAQRAARASASQARQLRLQASQVESLTQLLDDLRAEVEKLAQSAKMSRVRKANQHASRQAGDPDPYTSPDEWRAAMNKRLAEQRLQRGSV